MKNGIYSSSSTFRAIIKPLENSWWQQKSGDWKGWLCAKSEIDHYTFCMREARDNGGNRFFFVFFFFFFFPFNNEDSGEIVSSNKRDTGCIGRMIARTRRSYRCRGMQRCLHMQIRECTQNSNRIRIASDRSTPTSPFVQISRSRPPRAIFYPVEPPSSINTSRLFH